MDRRRTGSPVYSRQWSGGSSSTGSSSPAMSPAHPSSRLGPATNAFSTVKRTQNVAAKAAAQRLAQVMASQASTDDDEEDDLTFRFSVPTPPAPSIHSSTVRNGSSNITTPTISLTRPNRSPSPALGRNFVEHAPSVRSTSAGRSSMSVRSTNLVPPSKSSIKTQVSLPPIEPPSHMNRHKRFTSDVGQHSSKDTGDQREASALRDELDMLQEENENIIDKLRHAEERRQEAEARARELEKQVAALGEGVSLEAKLISRKEAALRQREAALRAAQQSNDGRQEEISALHSELENWKEEAATALEHLQEAESETKSLRTMTQRMILTKEEMEEVVLKRCWLARYWGLAVQHGICADTAISKHEHWSALAPLPFEVVISAGQKAKEESWDRDSKSTGQPKFVEAYELSENEAEDVLFKEVWFSQGFDSHIAQFSQDWNPTLAAAVHQEIAFGGPGCSSLGVGALSENGPFRPHGRTLVRNEYSWNREANMLYLETPVGVGFSYAANSSVYEAVNDEITGHYIPQLAKLMIEMNNDKQLFHLKGIALGNPVLEFATDFNSRAEYFWSHGLISDSTYRKFSKVCNYSRYVSEYYRDSVSSICSWVMTQVISETSRFVDNYDVTLDVCISSVLSQSKHASEKIDVCVEDEIVHYLNRKDVQMALHARLVGVRRWLVCSNILDYDLLNLEIPTIPIVGFLVKAGIRVLVYR
ncbi:hypothetical protein HS088_TW19G00595 [Tripterygium wilfordii]|uniref:Uncharacterized protein n=1 Tax=Tripterygium wilfordii TaxID=458696 RepID=A0A7J7CA71_TRIWF|nr:hypothetical protein HS088_TW19G00595 [Tripterygium wilfordii]